MAGQQAPNEFSKLTIRGLAPMFLEYRADLDGSGNALYEGWAYKPNASVDAEIWYIVKNTFTGTSKTRQQLPDNGPKFAYAWSNRASIFS